MEAAVNGRRIQRIPRPAIPVLGISERWGEQHFRQLLDKLPAGAYTCDRDGLITYFNQHAVELWGREPLLNNPADQFCGSHQLLNLSGDPIPRAECWMALALRLDKEYNGNEIIIEQPSGRRLNVLAHVNPIHDEAGTLVGAVNVLVDVTELKASQNREALLRQEIHHRVKNNLQVISSLLYLQSGRSQDPQMAELLRESQSRIRSIGLVHERLYKSAGVTKVEIKPYFNELVCGLFGSYQIGPPQVQFEVKAEDVFLSLDAAIPCGLIITELVSNSLKYAFPERRRGRIQIEANSVGQNLLRINMRDDGVGLPQGFSLENSPTLGMRLVRDLVRQLGGTLEVHNEYGTKVNILFPEPPEETLLG